MNKLTNKLPFITTKWFDIDVGLFYPELLYDKTIQVFYLFIKNIEKHLIICKNITFYLIQTKNNKNIFHKYYI